MASPCIRDPAPGPSPAAQSAAFPVPTPPAWQWIARLSEASDASDIGASDSCCFPSNIAAERRSSDGAHSHSSIALSNELVTRYVCVSATAEATSRPSPTARHSAEPVPINSGYLSSSLDSQHPSPSPRSQNSSFPSAPCLSAESTFADANSQTPAPTSACCVSSNAVQGPACILCATTVPSLHLDNAFTGTSIARPRLPLPPPFGATPRSPSSPYAAVAAPHLFHGGLLSARSLASLHPSPHADASFLGSDFCTDNELSTCQRATSAISRTDTFSCGTEVATLHLSNPADVSRHPRSNRAPGAESGTHSPQSGGEFDDGSSFAGSERTSDLHFSAIPASRDEVDVSPGSIPLVLSIPSPRLLYSRADDTSQEGDAVSYDALPSHRSVTSTTSGKGSFPAACELYAYLKSPTRHTFFEKKRRARSVSCSLTEHGASQLDPTTSDQPAANSPLAHCQGNLTRLRKARRVDDGDFGPSCVEVFIDPGAHTSLDAAQVTTDAPNPTPVIHALDESDSGTHVVFSAPSLFPVSPPHQTKINI
jgi:hypothetical protein